MDPLAAAILVGVPLAWLVGFAAYVYVDAPRHGMSRRKWAAIALFVPLFGFFAYLFERSELDYDPSEDPYAGGGDGRAAGFAVHESRRGERALGPAGTEANGVVKGDGDCDSDGDDVVEGDVVGGDGDDVGEGDGEERTKDDEWNDPDGVDA